MLQLVKEYGIIVSPSRFPPSPRQGRKTTEPRIAQGTGHQVPRSTGGKCHTQCDASMALHSGRYLDKMLQFSGSNHCV